MIHAAPLSNAVTKPTILDQLDRLLDRDLAPKGKSCLVQIHPAVGAGLVELKPRRITLGRDADCNLPLPDDSASRCHAEIDFHEGRYVLTDLNSTNGTYVNDRRIERHTLEAGDRLRIGKHIFKFLSADHIEAQYHETVYQMMTTDGLTGAYNKRYFLETLGRELVRSARCNRPLTLILFDADHFKQVNDTYGHLAGDEVLQELCRRARGALRRDELLARYGGEEFAVVLGEADRKEGARAGERLRQVMAAEPFLADGHTLKVTVSVGVASTRGDDAITVEELIRRADEKLYQAKSAGRNRVKA